MAISTNDLFHFTNFENLKGILKSNAFYPRYSLEFTFLSENFDRQASLLPVAMTCFCDIPIELNASHRLRYGNHAIVMSENWKITNKLNPVMYVQSNSNVAELLADFTKSAIGFIPLIEDKKNDIEVVKALGKVTRSLTKIQYYIKQFENKEETNIEYAGKIRHFEKRRFYDEREWRYVPSPEDFFVLPLDIREFDNPKKLNEANERLKAFPLDFKIEDIKYVIVNNASELSELKMMLGDVNLEIKISNEKYR